MLQCFSYFFMVKKLQHVTFTLARSDEQSSQFLTFIDLPLHLSVQAGLVTFFCGVPKNLIRTRGKSIWATFKILSGSSAALVTDQGSMHFSMRCSKGRVLDALFCKIMQNHEFSV